MWIYVPKASCPSAPEPGSSIPASKWRSHLLASSAALSTKHSPATSWLRAWKMKPWMSILFGRISTPLTAALGVERWTASLADTPASRSASLERDWEKKIRDTFGQGSENSSESSTPRGAGSKMSPGTSPEASGPFFRISNLSDSGWLETVASLRSDYSARRKSARATGGSASSFWPTARTVTGGAESAQRKQELGRKESGGGDLQAAAQSWPTPRTKTTLGDSGSRKRLLEGENPGLNDMASRWPTPTAMDSHSSGDTSSNPGSRRHPGVTLTDAASRNWATPTAPAPHDSEVSVGRERKDRPGYGLELVNQAVRWPTPNQRDHKGPDLKSRHGGASLPHFVETGERTHSPSSPQVQVTSTSGAELSRTGVETFSRLRLNPAFVCWLMGWPWWWTNPGRISFARSAMESYLSRLRTLLESLLVARDSSK